MGLMLDVLSDEYPMPKGTGDTGRRKNAGPTVMACAAHATMQAKG